LRIDYSFWHIFTFLWYSLLNFCAISLNRNDMLDVLIRERREDVRPGGGTEHSPVFMALLQLHGIIRVLL
jgi:hypothetical protein